jgi:POT family proton-dependent oligopeptide transporter
LILFLTASFTDGGWEWTRENASAFGSYVGLVYLSTMLGILQIVIGFRWAGASLMTLGHAAMAVETDFIYLGLVLLVLEMVFSNQT